MPNFSVQCSVFSVQCSVFSVLCSVFSACSVFSVQCSVFSIQRSVFSVNCSVFSIQCSVFSVQCSEFGVQCSVFSVQCSVFSIKFHYSRLSGQSSLFNVQCWDLPPILHLDFLDWELLLVQALLHPSLDDHLHPWYTKQHIQIIFSFINYILNYIAEQPSISQVYIIIHIV